VDADGVVVAPVTAYLGGLQACGRSAAARACLNAQSTTPAIPPTSKGRLAPPDDERKQHRGGT
jgi:hypothetical protein